MHAATRPMPPSVLMDGVQSVAFSYYGRYAPNRPLAWGERWQDRRTLPQLIRLRITLVGGRQLPDLIVAPRPAGPAQM